MTEFGTGILDTEICRPKGPVRETKKGNFVRTFLVPTDDGFTDYTVHAYNRQTLEADEIEVRFGDFCFANER
jgi:hypothetical protein